MRILTLILSLLILTGACNHKQTLEPHKWLPAGGEFDTLTLRLESDFYNFSPTDSVRHKIIRMEKLVDNKLKESRYFYWKAILYGRLKQKDSAFRYFRKALEINDSSAHYYDYLRFKKSLLVASDTTKNIHLYLFLTKCLQYAIDTGDNVLYASAAIEMGNLFLSIGFYERAITYYHTADSLNSLLGFEKHVAKNHINHASALNMTGKNKESTRMLKNLLENPFILEDSKTRNLVYRNLYSNTGDTNYLQIAYREIQEDDQMAHLRGFYSAVLSLGHFHTGNLKAGIRYARMALNDVPYVTDYNHRSAIYLAQSISQQTQGNLDSALFFRMRAEETADSQMKINQSIEVMRISSIHEIRQLETEQGQRQKKRNITIIIAGVLVILLAAIGFLLLNRRVLRHRISAMRTEIELEKTRRKIMASAVTIDEKDHLLEELRQHLSDLRRNHLIEEQDARRLETTIKSHLANHESEATFQDMFDTVNPKFTDRLRELCPDIADSYVKIACYILMDLDNKQIARLMMIKPESVRQARWRLGKKLNLRDDDDLTEKLRSLNT